MHCKSCSVEHSDGVQCSKCSSHTCFACANITEKNYRKLGQAKKEALLCQACKTSPAPATPEPQAALDLVLQEFRGGLGSINRRLDQIPVLIQEVQDLKEKINQVEISTKDIRNKIEALEIRVDKLEINDSVGRACPQFEKKIDQLTESFTMQEQRDRLNNVEIKGIPHRNNENLFEILFKIAEFLGRPVQRAEVDFITRTRSAVPGAGKPILVRFLGRYAKENFVAAAKKHKQLTASELGFSGSESRIYINDHLTRHNKQLLLKAKKLASEKFYKYVWVQNCKILVRKNDTSPIVHIINEDAFKNMK